MLAPKLHHTPQAAAAHQGRAGQATDSSPVCCSLLQVPSRPLQRGTRANSSYSAPPRHGSMGRRGAAGMPALQPITTAFSFCGRPDVVASPGASRPPRQLANMLLRTSLTHPAGDGMGGPPPPPPGAHDAQRTITTIPPARRVAAYTQAGRGVALGFKSTRSGAAPQRQAPARYQGCPYYPDGHRISPNESRAAGLLGAHGADLSSLHVHAAAPRLARALMLYLRPTTLTPTPD